MFEEFRQQADQNEFEQGDEFEEVPPPVQTRRSNRVLGMTPPQRFVIALMLLMMTCLLSALCLMVTERVLPPI